MNDIIFAIKLGGENMENEIEFIKQYFYGETKILKFQIYFLQRKKTSYFDNVNCYLTETKQNVNFYVFSGDVTYTNLYPIKANESLDEVYYKHIGVVAELTSKTVSIVDFPNFLNSIIPGHNSVKRRNTFNAIATKGWDYNSELVYKDSITVFDVMTSLNILTLIVSIISNLLTGNNMPFNRIKCPQCGCESYKMKMDENSKKYLHVCDFCGKIYGVKLIDIVKTI